MANALRDLRTRFGVGADALEADELFDLAEAVRRVENPFADVNADAMGVPAKVCEGVYLWRLTAGASAWLDEYAAKWWGDARHDRQYFWALVYAMRNARDREAFAGLTDELSARRAIRACVMSIPATDGEIAEAMDRALGRKDDGQRRDLRAEAVDWAHVLARLESQSGIPRDEWLWGRSAAYTARAYNDLVHTARACAAALGGQGRAERMRDEADKALDALAAVKQRIYRRFTAEREAAAKAAPATQGGAADG